MYQVYACHSHSRLSTKIVRKLYTVGTTVDLEKTYLGQKPMTSKNPSSSRHLSLTEMPIPGAEYPENLIPSL